MKAHKLLACAASAAMAVSMVGCSSGGSSDKKSSGGSSDSAKTLVVGTTQQLAGVLSPIFYTTSYDGWAINLVYQSMLQYDVNDTLVPELAEEMPEVSEDGKTVTFKLKEGIKFSDGSDLDANDVKFTFTLMADPSYDGRFTNNVNFIDGYEDYHDGDAKDLSGIEVVDDHTIVFHLNTERIDIVPTIGLQDIISDTQFGEDGYKKGDLGKYKSDTSDMLGSGAYKLNSYDKSTGASFVKNEEYTGEGDYKIERVIIKTIAEATELTSLQSGDINYLPSQIEGDIIGPASLDENLAYNHYFRPAEGYFGFNCKSGPTADQAVRQALCYATNRVEFADAYYKYPEASEELEKIKLGYQPVVYWNPVSESLGEYVTGEKKLDGLTVYDYDLEKAKSVLEEAGWKVGSDGIREKDGKKLEIKFLASEGNSVLEMLIPMIMKSYKEVGIDLKQTTVDFNTLVDTVSPTEGDKSSSDDWSIFFMAASYTSNQNVDSNSNLVGGGGDNYSGIDNKELNEALDKGMNTADQKVSDENYQKAMILENTLVPYFPIYGNEYFDIYANNVKGFKTSPLHDWSQAMDTAYIE